MGRINSLLAYPRMIFAAIFAVAAVVVVLSVYLPDESPGPGLVASTANIGSVSEEPDYITSLAIIPEAPLILKSGNGIVVINIEANTLERSAEIVYRPVSMDELEDELPKIPAAYTEITRTFDLTIEATADAETGNFTFLKPITITIKYNTNDLNRADGDPDNLAVLHFHDGRWNTLESVVTENESTISAQVDELSIFGLAISETFIVQKTDVTPIESSSAINDSVDDLNFQLPPNLLPVLPDPLTVPFTQEGPTGPRGLAGPQGDPGIIGPIGLTGLLGPMGMAGLIGEQGPIGPSGGEKGDIGPLGNQGPAGERGIQGEKGPEGPPGLWVSGGDGPPGPASTVPGPAGPAGPAGTAGATGPAGPQGVAGPGVTADSLDFTEFKDALALDASTTITQDGSETLTFANTGTGALIINLASTGDFIIQDNGVAAATFADDGSVTLAGTLAINGDAITADGATLTITPGTTVDVVGVLNANSITSDAGVSIAAGNTYTGAGAVMLASAAGTALSVDSGTTGALNIGTGANAKTISVGNTTGATALNLSTGTGNFTLNGVAGSTYTIGAATTTGTITIGGTAQTGTMTFGSSSGTSIVNIGAGEGATTVNIAGGATNAKTVTIGTGAVANTITIGSATATGVSITDNNWSISASGAGVFTNLSSGGHITTTGTVPTSVATSGGTGGGAGTLVATSTDVAGQFTTNSTAGTTTVLTFASAYTTAPNCVIAPSNSAAAAEIGTAASVLVVTSTTTLTLTHADVATLRFDYICIEGQ